LREENEKSKFKLEQEKLDKEREEFRLQKLKWENEEK